MNEEPKLNRRDWQVYDAMKDLIVGEEYFHAKTLIIMINNVYSYHVIPVGADQILRRIIKRLRRSTKITRIIESCRDGYRMPITKPEGISLIGIRTLKSIETCLLSGNLHQDQIYEVVNRYRKLHHAKHGQQRIQVGKYTNREVRRISDDIYKGELR